jgi:hypothetical protein
MAALEDPGLSDHDPDLWVPKNLVTSRDLDVFVDQPAKTIDP